jgi:hypothetical protein
MPRTPLTLTPEQRTAALAKAAVARHEKGELLEKIRKGEHTATHLMTVRHEEDRVKKMPVLTLLRALPGVSVNGARNAMRDAAIDERRKVGGLGVRQKAALLAWLNGR